MSSWTADGRWIYFGLFGGGPPRMCRIRPDGTEFKVVGEGIDPAVSPDGRTIAFARSLPKGHCLFAMDADGSNVRQLTRKGNPWAGVHAAWTPDGRQIVYSDAVTRRGVVPLRARVRRRHPTDTPRGRLHLTFRVPVREGGRFRLCDEVDRRDEIEPAGVQGTPRR